MRQGTGAALAASLAGALLSGHAVAQTEAGQVITNQAEATFFDPLSGASLLVLSNTTLVQVRPVYGFNLSPGMRREAEAGAQICFPHTLTNRGNAADRFSLSALAGEEGAGPLLYPTVYADGDGDGDLGPEERTLAATGLIAPGQSLDLLLCGHLPATAAADETYTAAIQALSERSGQLERAIDEALVLSAAPFSLSKTAEPSCPAGVGADGRIAFRIDARRLDRLPQTYRSYRIDGAPVEGFLIEDTLPANVSATPLTQVEATPSETIAVALPRGGSDQDWIRFSSWDGVAPLEAIGLFAPADAQGALTHASLSFDVQVNPNLTAGTVIRNRASLELAGGSGFYASQDTCSRAGEAAPDATIRFLEPSADVRSAVAAGSSGGPTISSDSDYATSSQYSLAASNNYNVAADGVYLEVSSSTLNSNAAVADSTFNGQPILVRVTSALTGDEVFVQVVETGPNTGVFRSLVPFSLTSGQFSGGGVCSPATTPAGCILASASGDTLTATILDPGLQVSVTAQAVVDAFGVVFDSTDFEPVAGAQVFIFNASGSRAEDPDQPGRELPGQFTGADGRYQLPELGAGQYYLQVEPPERYAFPSLAQPSLFNGVYTVTDASYGLDGRSGARSGLFSLSGANAQAIIDVPLDPDLSRGQLNLVKEAAPAVVNFGDRVNYTLTIANDTGAPLFDVGVFDAPARGLTLLDGSARYDDRPVTAVRLADGSLRFDLGMLDADETGVLTYQMLVTRSGLEGELENTAYVEGRAVGSGPIARSPLARASVIAEDDGVLSDRAVIIGTVWIDRDGDGRKDASEPPVPGARIWFDDGAWVSTDALGRYSIFGARSGLRAAKLDPLTIPSGLSPVRADNRMKAATGVRLVDLAPGEMHRADYPLACVEGCDPYRGENVPQSVLDELAKRSETHSFDAMLDDAYSFESAFSQRKSIGGARRFAAPGPDGDASNGAFGVGMLRDRHTGPGAVHDAQVGEDADPQGSGSGGPAQAPDPEEAASSITKAQAKVGAWLWPTSSVSRDGRFIVVIPASVEPTLYVNGRAVPPSKLGARVENRAEAAQIAAWYGVELLEGENEVEVRAVDPFGNERLLASGVFARPGAPATLEIAAPSKRFAADGRTRARVEVRLLDKMGLPVSGQRFAHIETTAGELIGQDMREDEFGLQIRLRDGRGVFELQSPSSPAEARVSVKLDSGESENLTVHFVNPARDLLAIGVIEAGSRISGAGQSESAVSADLPDDEKVKARGSLFLTGKVKGDAILTFAYDSDKDVDEELLRDLDPSRYYPTYGDASDQGFLAQSRSQVYAKVEKDGAMAMWGDYVTDSQAGDSLGRSQRQLTGLNAKLEKGPLAVQVFAAETDKLTKTERIRGNGTAMFIELPGAPIEPRSEILVIETRDRNNPGLVIDERPLTRFRDYILDETTGELTLQDVLPTFDADGNPVYLRATYETREDAEAALVAGARAQISGEKGRVWASLTDDQSENRDHTMAAVGSEAYVGENGRVWAEAAWLNGAEGDGQAVRLGGEGRILGFDVRGEFAEASAGFDNPDSPVAADRREIRAQAEREYGQAWTLRAAYSSSEQLSSQERRDTGQVLLEAHMGDWTLSAGPRYTRAKTGQSASERLGAVARMRRAGEIGGRPASLFVQGEQSLMGDAGSRAEIGADIEVRDGARLYARHTLHDNLPDETFAPGLNDEFRNDGQARTVVGVETEWLGRANVYGEWRITDSLGAATGEAVYGISADWEIRPDLNISPRFEAINTLDGPQANDAVAFSLGVADQRNENARRSARVETRLSDSSDYVGLNLGWAQRFDETLSGAAKLRMTWEDPSEGLATRQLLYTMGLAHRPTDGGVDWLALYQYEHAKGPGAAFDTNVHVGSLTANRAFGSNVLWSGRIAGKYENAAGVETTAALADTRFTWDMARRWDLDIRGGARYSLGGDVVDMSYGPALSLTPVDGVRVTLGYNIAGFSDRYLDRGLENREGLYWRVSATFDESWFGWLQ